MAAMKVRRIDLSPSEYLAGVGGKLTLAEFAVYWQICLQIYDKGKPIDDDHYWLSRQFAHGTDPRSVRAAIESLVRSGKVERLDPDSNVWRNGCELMVNRCLTELQRSANRAQTAQDNGTKGGRPKHLEEPGGLESEKLTINHQPSTINHQVFPQPPPGARSRKTKIELTEAERLAFDEWWPHFPVHEGKKPAQYAFKAALAKASMAELIAGAQRYARRLKLPDAPQGKWPQGWLNDERWNDEWPNHGNGNSNGNGHTSRYDPTEKEIQTQITRAKRLRDSGDAAWSYSTDEAIEAAIRMEHGCHSQER
jgi:hypothetical protein